MPRRSAILNRRVLYMSEGIRSGSGYPSRDVQVVSAATPVTSTRAADSAMDGVAVQLRSPRRCASTNPLLDLPVGACSGNSPSTRRAGLVVRADPRQVLLEWRGVTWRPRRFARCPTPCPTTMLVRCDHGAAPDLQSFRGADFCPQGCMVVAGVPPVFFRVDRMEDVGDTPPPCE